MATSDPILNLLALVRRDDNGQTPLAKALSLAKEWDESEHPREADGRFGAGGSSGKSQAVEFTQSEQAKAWAQEHFNDAGERKYKSGDPVASYFDFGFKNINGYLRNPKSVDSDYHREIKDSVKAVKAEMRPVPEGGVVAFRGFDASAISNLKVGDTFTEKAFSSTSLDQKVAKQFAEEFSNGKGVVARIEIPEGTKALYPSNDVLWGKGFTNENELLLPPALRYEITSTPNNGGEIGLRVIQK